MATRINTITLKGIVTLKIIDKNGQTIHEETINNTITKAGMAEVAKLIAAGLGGSRFGYIAIGTGSTSPSVNDTALEHEIDRKPAYISLTSTNYTNDTVVFEATFSPAEQVDVSEAGIFNSSVGGTMLSRVTFAAKTVGPDTALKVEWKIIIGSA